MVKHHYDEYMFFAVAFSFGIIAVLSFFDLISDWKVLICSVSSALLSISQNFNIFAKYEKLQEEQRNRINKLIKNDEKIPKHRTFDFSPFVYICAVIILIVGFSVEGYGDWAKLSNFITLVSFSIISIGYLFDTVFSRKISELNKKIAEAETLKRLEEI